MAKLRYTFNGAFVANGRSGRNRLKSYLVSMASLMLVGSMGCHWNTPRKIAVIPRTSGTMLWEPEHGGARTAAATSGMQVYWNAPTREDDVEAQIALVESISRKDYQGLILAPDQTLALITPVRRAIARGLPTVIVSSPLPIHAEGKLSYILNDEEGGGRIAARRVAVLLHGRGSVAVLGINPDISGIMVRARSFEEFLTQNYPNIHIVEKRTGSFNVPHEQQVVEETLKAHPEIDVIVALMWASTRSAISTIDSRPGDPVKVVGFDPEGLPFSSPGLDSLIVQNTREMGSLAVLQIEAQLRGQSVSPVIRLEPTLVTRENLNSEMVRNLISMDWGSGAIQFRWSEVR
jgi:ribose transport system substrate-binding protein